MASLQDSKEFIGIYSSFQSLHFNFEIVWLTVQCGYDESIF